MAFIKKLAFAASIAIVGGVANATPCDSILSSYGSPGCNSACQAQLVSEHPECFAGGSVSSGIQIAATSFTQISTISSALASRFLSAAPGPRAAIETKSMAAGGQAGLNVWGSVAGNNTQVRFTNLVNTRTQSDADVLNWVVGADYALSPTMVLGVSGAFDRGEGASGITTGIPNKVGTSGYTIAPYLGMQLSKELALDVSAGLGSGDMTVTGGVTSEADRWFGAANLSYNQWMGNYQITGKLGYLHGEEDYGDSKANGVTQANTASKNKLDQARLGVQVGYWMNGLMPYAGVAYTADIKRSVSNAAAAAAGNPVGKDALIWTLGLNLFSLTNKMTGGIAYNQETGRSNSRANSLMANLNIRF